MQCLSLLFPLHVCDREADDYDFYCHLVNNEVGWVVRASRLNRKVYKGFEGNTIPNRKNQVALKSIADSSQVIGEYELEVLPNKKQKGSIAKLDRSSYDDLYANPNSMQSMGKTTWA